MTTPRPAVTVLMTASVAPKAGIRENLKRSDPVQRLEDYRAALRFWLDLDEPRLTGIVFAENTAFPLAELEAFARAHNSHGRALEFLSFDHPAPKPEMNYGQAEFRLVTEALERSAVAAGTAQFMKVTGRYTFPSVSRLLGRLPDGLLIAGDTKGFRLFGRKAVPLIPTALILFRTDFYRREVAPLVETMLPAPPWTRKQYIETVLFDAFYSRRAEPGMVLRWPCNCEPRGIGANGDNYASLRKRLQAALRASARLVWPSLWI